MLWQRQMRFGASDTITRRETLAIGAGALIARFNRLSSNIIPGNAGLFGGTAGDLGLRAGTIPDF